MWSKLERQIRNEEIRAALEMELDIVAFNRKGRLSYFGLTCMEADPEADQGRPAYGEEGLRGVLSILLVIHLVLSRLVFSLPCYSSF